jgi:CRP/FNR family transcriptional regulator, cyclic AMP receptor protein
MLEQVSLFAKLPLAQLTELESLAVKATIPKNTVVFSEGDRGDTLYIILRGRANAIRNDNSGRQLVINRFGPCDYFGEMGFLDGAPRCATVVTKTRCDVLAIPHSHFVPFSEEHPAILWDLITALLDKLRKTTQQLQALAFSDVYSRLTLFLNENRGKNGMLDERFTQQELADIVGASRETVCRIVNELNESGYLDKKGSRIVIRKKIPYKF